MKKTYQSPETREVKFLISQYLLVQSEVGGVATGGTPGDEYTSTDVSYGRRGSSLWDDDED